MVAINVVKNTFITEMYDANKAAHTRHVMAEA